MAITNFGELRRKILEEVSYDPETGEFTWARSGRGRFKRRGANAGGDRGDGYVTICVERKQWLGHRLAWVIGYGEEPPRVIDHINRNKSDNRLSNLRDGSNGVNEFNSRAPISSPFKISGVRPSCKKGHYQSYTSQGGKFKSFYHGPDFFEACCRRKSWEAEYARSL